MAGSILVATRRVLVAARGIFCCGARAPQLRCASSLLAGAGFSLIVAHRLSGPVEYGIFVPNQGLHLHPLPLENRFLTTGPPGEFQVLHSKEDTQRVFRKALAWTAHD